MGCGNWVDIINPINEKNFDFLNPVDPLGVESTLLGNIGMLQFTPISAASFDFNHSFNMIKEDWRKIKHMLIPDLRRDREVTTTASNSYRKLIYGRVKVGVQLAYICSSGSKNEYLHLVGIFAGHPIDSFESIYSNDKLVTDATIAPYFYYELFDGTQTTACQSLITASNGQWTSAHVLKGLPYIYARLTYNEIAFPNGCPEIKAVIKGRRVYDPRTGLTAWSDNPMLCAMDYMRMPNEYGGMGCTADEMPTDAEIIARANYCDELVM